MRKAERSDRAWVVDLLARSFDENPSVNYIVRRDGKRKARVKALMAYSFDVCLLFGDIWIANDRKACALVLYPDQKKTTIKAIWLDIKLIFQAVSLGGIAKTLNREAEIKKKQLKVSMVYLDIMRILTTLFRAKLTIGLTDVGRAANAIKACTKIVIYKVFSLMAGFQFNTTFFSHRFSL